MRKLVAALITWLALAAPALAQIGPPNQVQCNAFATFTGTGAVATVIPGVAGKVIYFCGWHITSTSSTTTTFQFSVGTAANCGGGTNITPALNVTITAPSQDHIDYATLSYGSSGGSPNNVCVNAPATVTGGIWYGQY